MGTRRAPPAAQRPGGRQGRGLPVGRTDRATPLDTGAPSRAGGLAPVHHRPHRPGLRGPAPAGRPEVLLSGSATGFYGNRGDEILTEASGPGEGFLSELCRRWESAADPAARAGLRTVQSRTGLVVSSSGGLGRILGAAYRVGAGARLGRGDQWQPWIALEDAAGRLLWAIEHDDVHGPVNLTAPEPARNRDLHRLLSRAGGPPSVAVVPQLLLDRAGRAGAAGGTGSIGGMLAELLGASQRAVPQALLASGFRFTAPDAASIWALGA